MVIGSNIGATCRLRQGIILWKDLRFQQYHWDRFQHIHNGGNRVEKSQLDLVHLIFRGVEDGWVEVVVKGIHRRPSGMKPSKRSNGNECRNYKLYIYWGNKNVMEGKTKILRKRSKEHRCEGKARLL